MFTDETKETYKSTTQVLREISGIWDELNDKAQAGLLEKLFGKTRAQAGAAILSNFERVENALEAMERSAGSADKEMAVIEQSIDFKINKLRETWTGFAQDVIKREDVGNIVDDLTGISDGLQRILSFIGPIGTAIAGIGLVNFVRYLTSTKNAISGIGRIFAKDLTNIPKTLDNISMRIQNFKTEYNKYMEAFGEDAAPLLTSRLRDVSQLGGEGAGIASTFSLLTNPIFVSTAALTALVGGLVLYSEYVDKAGERAVEAMEKSKAEYASAQENISNLNSELETTQSRIDELLSKESLTFVEQEELNNLREENNLLEANLAIEKERERVTKSRLERDTKNAFEVNYGAGYNVAKIEEDIKKIKQLDQEISDLGGGIGTESKVAEREQLIDQDDIAYLLKLRRDIQEKFNDAQEKFDKAIKPSDKASWGQVLTTYQTQLDNLNESLIIQRDNLSGYLNDSVEGSAFYNDIKDVLEAINREILSPSTFNNLKINELFNTDALKDQRKEIAKLAKEGNLTKDSFDGLGKSVESLNLKVDDGTDAWDYFVEAMAAEQDAAEAAKAANNDLGSSYDELLSKALNFGDKIDTITTALSQQNENGHLTSEMVKTLTEQFAGIDEMLVQTANGFRLNEAQVREYMASLSAQQVEELRSQLQSLSDEYDSQTEHLQSLYYQLGNATGAESANASAIREQISAVQLQRQATADLISTFQAAGVELDSQLDKWNAFKSAMSTTNQGSRYDYISSSKDAILKLAQEDAFNADEMRTFVDYLTSADFSNASMDEVKEAWQESYAAAQRYFTGTKEGVDNFYNDLVSKSQELGEDVVGFRLLEDGTSEFTDMEKAADTLGISLNALVDLLDKMSLYTDTVKFGTVEEEFEELNATVSYTAGEMDALKKKRDALADDKVNMEIGADTSEVDAEIQKLDFKIAGLNTLITMGLDDETKEAIRQVQQLNTERKDYTTDSKEYISKTNEIESLLKDTGINLGTAISINVDDADLLDAIKTLKEYKGYKDELAESETETLTIKVDDEDVTLSRDEINAAFSEASEKAKKAGLTIEEALSPKAEWTATASIIDGLNSALDALEIEGMDPTELKEFKDAYDQLAKSMVEGLELDVDTTEALKHIYDLNQEIEEINDASVTGHITAKIDKELEGLDIDKDTAVTLGAVLQVDNEEAESAIDVVLEKVEGLKDPVEVTLGLDSAYRALMNFSRGLDREITRQRELNIKVPSVTVPSISFGNLSSHKSNSTETGTQSVNGTANAQGNWGLKKSGKTLVGELGQELLVRGSHYQTIGDNGPEMVDLKQGDIIFNHKQTEDLLSHGHTATRGKALAQGTMSGGNVDVYNRPIVIMDKDRKEYATTATSFQEKWYGDEETGGYRVGHFTPILQDGTWLEDNVLLPYVDKVLSALDPMIEDANGYKIFYKVDTMLSDGITKITDANLKQAFKEAEEWDIAMHDFQDSLYREKAMQMMSGKAFARGKDLTGEVGPEMRVDTRNGKYELLGLNGPEMTTVHPWDIIYPADQTKDILSGDSFLYGNAYSNVSGKISNALSGASKKTASAQKNTATQKYASTQKYTSTQKYETGTSTVAQAAKAVESAAKATAANTEVTKKNTEAQEEKTHEFDWLERALNEPERVLEALEELASDEYNSYKTRKDSYEDLIRQNGVVADTLKEIYNRRTEDFDEQRGKLLDYFNPEEVARIIDNIQKGNLKPGEWKETRKYEGSNDGSDAANAAIKAWEDGNQAVENIIQAYDDMLEANKKWQEQVKKARDYAKEAYELDISYYETMIDKMNAVTDNIQVKMDVDEITGGIVKASDYEKMISATNSTINYQKGMLDTMYDRLATLDPDSSEYWEVQKSITSAQSAIKSAEKQQYEWNEAIKQMPIDHIEAYIDNLKSVMDDLSNYASQLSAKGQSINSDVIKKQMELQQLIVDQYVQDAQLLQDKMDSYTPGSDKWNETFRELQNIDNEISSIVESMIDYNKQLLAMPVEKLTKVADKLKNIQSAIDSYQDDNVTVIDAAVAAIERSTEAYQEQQDVLQDEQKAIQKIQEGLEDQQKAIQKRKDALQDQIDIYEDQQEQIQRQSRALSDKIDEYQDEQTILEREKRLLQDQVDLYEDQQEQIQRKSRALQDQIELYQDEQEQLERAKRPMQDQIDAYQDEQDQWQRQQKLLNRQIKEYQKQQEQIQKDAEERVKPLQDELDILNKQNAARQRQLSLDQAAYDLQKAREQKTVQVKDCLGL